MVNVQMMMVDIMMIIIITMLMVVCKDYADQYCDDDNDAHDNDVMTVTAKVITRMRMSMIAVVMMYRVIGHSQ